MSDAADRRIAQLEQENAELRREIVELQKALAYHSAFRTAAVLALKCAAKRVLELSGQKVFIWTTLFRDGEDKP